MPDCFPHGYALLIGVGRSSYEPWSLPVTVRDVQALTGVLTDAARCAFPQENLLLLHDERATRQGILQGLSWLRARAESDPEITAFVYYSGHGWLDETTGSYYLLPHDVTPFDVQHTALSAPAFTDALHQLPAQRLLVIVDTCHAEGMATAKDIPSPSLPQGMIPISLPKSVVGQLKQSSGRAVFTSSRGSQRSWVRPDGSMSIYTYHLLEALQGAGNRPGDTLVRVSNLMNHLGKSVPESARALCQAEQTPFFDTATEDFPVAVVRGGAGLPAEGWQEPTAEASPRIRQEATIGGSGAISQVAGGSGGIAVGGNVHGGVHSGTGDIVADPKSDGDEH